MYLQYIFLWKTWNPVELKFCWVLGEIRARFKNFQVVKPVGALWAVRSLFMINAFEQLQQTFANRTYSFSSGIYLRKANKKDTGRVSVNVIPVSVVNVE